MKQVFILVLAIFGVSLAGKTTNEQFKIGVINIEEIYPLMPEYKKADTAMAELQNALSQQFNDMRNEFTQQSNLLNSKDSSKYTSAQLELKRKNLGELYEKVNGFQQQAEQLIQQKQQELMKPLQQKAIEAVQAVSKENGYSYILRKEALLVYPPADDIFSQVKIKLGLK